MEQNLEYRIHYFQKRLKRFAFFVKKSSFIEDWICVNFHHEGSIQSVKDNSTLLNDWLMNCSYTVNKIQVEYDQKKVITKHTQLEILFFATIELLIDYLVEMNVNPNNIRASVYEVV